MEGEAPCGAAHGPHCARLHRYDGQRALELSDEQFAELTQLCGRIVTGDAACLSLIAAGVPEGERMDHVFALILGPRDVIETRATPGAFQHSVQPTDAVRDQCNVPFQPDDEVAALRPDGEVAEEDVPFVPPPHVPAVAVFVIVNRTQRVGGRRQCSIYMRPRPPPPPPRRADDGVPGLISEYSDDDNDNPHE